MTEAFLKTTKGDPVAMLHILNTFVDTPRDVIAGFQQPTEVICGADDRDNGVAQELAALMPKGSYVDIPGNHMNAGTRKARMEERRGWNAGGGTWRTRWGQSQSKKKIE